MKKLLLILSIMLVTGCQTNTFSIDNPDETVITVDGKTVDKKSYYDVLTKLNSLNVALNHMDEKSFIQAGYTYDKDERIKKEVDTGLKILATYPKEKLDAEMNEYDASSPRDLIDKHYMLSYQKRYATIDIAYDKIFTKKEKQFVYDNYIFGASEFEFVLFRPNTSSLDNPDDLTRAKTTAKNKANDVFETIKADGWDKATKDLKKYQTGEIKLDDPNYSPAFLDAAFKLQEGYSPVVETNMGYVIIHPTKIGQKPTMEASKQDIAAILFDRYLSENQHIEEYAMLKYRKQHNLVFDDKKLNDAYKAYSKTVTNAFNQNLETQGGN